MKVTVIGAGSVGFTRAVVQSVLSVPEFKDTLDVVLTDINARNLEMVHKLIKKDFTANRVKSRLSATTNRRQALQGANYVFSFVRVGGLEAFQTDIDIPLRYGVDQCVGDTLCAGGIMYAQRTIHALLEFMKDISEVAAPHCMFINHSNPMVMNTWACNKYGHGIKTVGLCHGVEGGVHQIADVMGVQRKEVDVICAGINHQTWYTKVLVKGREVSGAELLEKFANHSVYRITEKTRIDVLRRFGYYTTESNGHCSEYLAWYRKNPEDLMNWIHMGGWINGETGGYLRVCLEGRKWFEKDFPNWLKGEAMKYDREHRCSEHGPFIMEALETGRIYRGHFNMPNNGIITNLPYDAIVEAPGYVDRLGVHMPFVGALPMGPAAVCNASLSVQRLGMEAAVSGNDELLRQAFMMDPLTGAVCNPPQIWQMVDEMLVAGEAWLPQYKKAIADAKKRLANKSNLLPVREGYQGAARLPVNDPDKQDKEIAAQKGRPLPSLTVPRLAKPVGGNPEKVDWTTAVSTQTQVHNAGYQAKRTAEIRLAHDGTHLYVGIVDICDANALSNSQPFAGDHWELFIGRKRTAPYRQLGLAAGGTFTAVAVASGRAMTTWKNTVRVSSVVEPHTWRLSLSIPLAEIAEKAVKPGDVVYANLLRGAAESKNELAWSPTFSKNYHVPAKFAELTLAK